MDGCREMMIISMPIPGRSNETESNMNNDCESEFIKALNELAIPMGMAPAYLSEDECPAVSTMREMGF